MATTSSPQATDLETTILRALDLDHVGQVDVLGMPSVVHVVDLDNSSASQAFYAMWNESSVDWGAPHVIIRVTAASHIVVHIDNNFVFGDAVTIAQSTTPTGVASLAAVNMGIFASENT